eukprot:snap_masked-scaffold_65-processed-gene-0.6-mRNA-1 protein AED:1.00 eAED:1.00 QI:0/-1/0/0/-1/1/1/0/73
MYKEHFEESLKSVENEIQVIKYFQENSKSEKYDKETRMEDSKLSVKIIKDKLEFESRKLETLLRKWVLKVDKI